MILKSITQIIYILAIWVAMHVITRKGSKPCEITVSNHKSCSCRQGHFFICLSSVSKQNKNLSIFAEIAEDRDSVNF